MNVLIVDDQPSARTMLRHVIEGIGPAVHVSDFGNPVDALRWSRTTPPTCSCSTTACRGRPRIHPSLSRAASRCADRPHQRGRRRTGAPGGARCRRHRFLVKRCAARMRSRCKNLLQMRRQGGIGQERARSLEQKVFRACGEIEQRGRGSIPPRQGDRIPRLRHGPPAAHGAPLGTIAEEIGMSEKTCASSPWPLRCMTSARSACRTGPAQARQPDRRNGDHAQASADRRILRDGKPLHPDRGADRFATTALGRQRISGRSAASGSR